MSRINWSKALADYLKDETQSYASIASKLVENSGSNCRHFYKEDVECSSIEDGLKL